MSRYLNNLLKLSDAQIDTLPAGEFLLDTGLLFEINRRILHPLGLALVAVKNEETGEYEISDTLVDGRHITGGLLFDEITVIMAEDELFKFMEEFGVGKMQERQRLRKFIIQRSEEIRESESL